MGKPFSILHISDLHRSPRDPISNDELISALIGDCDRYVHEDPVVTAPEALVVSGDIIQGVSLGHANYEAELKNRTRSEGELVRLIREELDRVQRPGQ